MDYAGFLKINCVVSTIILLLLEKLVSIVHLLQLLCCCIVSKKMLKRIETLQRHKVRRLHVRSKFWVAIEALSAADHLPGLLKVLRFDHEHSLGNARGLRLEADSEYRCLLLADRSLGRIDREAQAGIGSEGCAKVGKAHVFVLDLKVRARVAKVWIEKSKMNGERKVQDAFLCGIPSG